MKSVALMKPSSSLLGRERWASMTLSSMMLTLPCLISRPFCLSWPLTSLSNAWLTLALSNVWQKRHMVLWSGIASDRLSPTKRRNSKSRASFFSNAGSDRFYHDCSNRALNMSNGHRQGCLVLLRK